MSTRGANAQKSVPDSDKLQIKVVNRIKAYNHKQLLR